MKVRIVEMTVTEGCVPMRVAVRFSGRRPWWVLVLMMVVVEVQVFVLEPLVNVLVLVPLGEV